MKIRGTATDRLADVIQSLQLVRKSGLLTVEHDGPGNSSDLGIIVFRNGQIIETSVGLLRGDDALKKLVAWTTCRFIFEPAPPTPISPSTSPLPPTAGYTGQIAKRRNQQTSTTEHLPPLNVPYRSQHLLGGVPDFQRLGLSRIHRQLFLLVDGKRSSQELARLLSHHHQEILAILADLAYVGLIDQ